MYVYNDARGNKKLFIKNESVYSVVVKMSPYVYIVCCRPKTCVFHDSHDAYFLKKSFFYMVQWIC